MEETPYVVPITGSLQIQVYSDLHLDSSSTIPLITPTAPYLFLAGDISQINHSSFGDFLEYCNNNWQRVLYVLGNHEFWDLNSDIQSIANNVRKYVNDNNLDNIEVLFNNIASLTDDIYVFGSTFCTAPTEVGTIADFSNIRFVGESGVPQLLSLGAMQYLSNRDYKAIKYFLQRRDGLKDKKVIIMTHFPPCTTGVSSPIYDNESAAVKSYYAHPDGTLATFTGLDNVICWIGGHTHYSYDFVEPQTGVRLISNQMGYTTESNTGYNESGLFTVGW